MSSSPFLTPGLALATGWRDYELLAGGGGLKLERWGSYHLVRPDPQIIWPKATPGPWAGWDGMYHRASTGGGQWEFRRPLPPEGWEVAYGSLRFLVRPTGFKHTGLFPEQAVNWDRCQAAIRRAGRPVSVINLFGYTGAATLACAAAGASVCHVDAAKGMVQWCRDNAARSGLAEAPIRYIVDDCVAFVRRELSRGRRYDGIILDPPSYGRGKDGQTWKLEDDLPPLLAECSRLLSDQPLFVLLNSYTTGLSPVVTANLLSDVRTAWAARTGQPTATGTIACGEVGLPFAREPQRVLPCGAFTWWQTA